MPRAFVLLSLIICLVSFAIANGDHYVFDSETGSYYKEVRGKLPWNDAVEACAAEGAFLHAPATEREASALLRRFSNDTGLVWLGLHDLFGEGHFITLEGIAEQDVYTNWAMGEPNNYNDEHCAVLLADGQYNDGRCWDPARFICKRNGRLSSTDGPSYPFFRKDYTFNSVYRAFYKLHPAVLPWSEALATCTAEGAELGAPTTKSEKDAFVHIMKSSSLWLGISDLNSNGNFATLNNTSAQSIFMNWAHGQPDNKSGNENCVQMLKSGLYNDEDCGKSYSFICKKNVDSITTSNPLCETYDTDYVYSFISNHCYKYHATPGTWNEAYKTCYDEGSYLGIIDSAEEAQVYMDTLSNSSINNLQADFNTSFIHSGFSDILRPGVFKTIGGLTLEQTGYDVWANGQPSSKAHCGAVGRLDGRLYAIGCRIRAQFICEKTLAWPLSLNVSLEYTRGGVHLCAIAP